MSDDDCGLPPLFLRDAVNVPDALQRDRLVRRIRLLRDDVVLDRDTIMYWNETHPDEPQLSTQFEDAVIAWLDGIGPEPDWRAWSAPPQEAP